MSDDFDPRAIPKMVDCPNCKGAKDDPVNIWFRTAPLGVMSAILTKSGQRETISYEVWRCLSCGHVLTETDIDRAELANKPMVPTGETIQ